MITDIETAVDAAENFLDYSVNALASIKKNIAGPLGRALPILCDRSVKVIVCGMGKSGYIAQKISATFNSIGVHSVFLHPAEAAHGDLGIYTPGDPSILISKSGSTEEILRLLPILKRFKSPIIAIVGDINSPLAKNSDLVFDINIKIEGDPLGIIPTTSTILSLAVGDAIACGIMNAIGFSKNDFACFHPGGQLGRNLLLSVGDIMHRLSDVAVVKSDLPLRDVLIRMTEHPLGAAIVMDDGAHMLGIITDGDIRRALQKNLSMDEIVAIDIMTSEPRKISENDCLGEALRVMESGSSQVYVLPVVDGNDSTRTVGLLRLHDAYQGYP
ncbi:MAG: KpsF/GutQ family sugar-phosphate isomerase [Puniceicoccales bacterium]|nr:KpsF/GutQ family sugar-phosphate isomerase [Puniceicoccales bacterium]